MSETYHGNPLTMSNLGIGLTESGTLDQINMKQHSMIKQQVTKSAVLEQTKRN